MGRETRQKVGWQNVRPAKGCVAHDGVAHRLNLVFLSSVGVRIGGCGITEVELGSCAEGVKVSRGDGWCVR